MIQRIMFVREIGCRVLYNVSGSVEKKGSVSTSAHLRRMIRMFSVNISSEIAG